MPCRKETSHRKDSLMELMKFTLLFAVLDFTLAKPHGFDDEGEMSVPRSPKIQGPSVVTLYFSRGAKPENLICETEGSPTPTVSWLKDGQEIQRDVHPYNTTHNLQNGTMELEFLKPAYNDEKYLTGNFTCVVANFLGRVQKTFRVSLATDLSSSTPSIRANATDDGVTDANAIIPSSTRTPDPTTPSKSRTDDSANSTLSTSSYYTESKSR